MWTLNSTTDNDYTTAPSHFIRTAHFRQRKSQRGIATSVERIILDYGDIERRQYDGRVAVGLSRNAADDLVASGIMSDAEARQAQTTELVLDGGHVITGYRCDRRLRGAPRSSSLRRSVRRPR